MPYAPKVHRAGHTAKQYDQHRDTHGWHRWYKLQRWVKRRKRQLELYPLCVECAAEGRTIKATVADHVVPHRGDYELFWNGELQSMCAMHHNRKTAAGF